MKTAVVSFDTKVHETRRSGDDSKEPWLWSSMTSVQLDEERCYGYQVITIFLITINCN